MSKACIKCGTTKALDQFYRCPRMKDGHFNKCISCFSEYAKRTRRERRAHIIQQEKVRRQKPERKAAECLKKQRQRRENPQRYTVNNAVYNAIRSGRLIKQPCEVCQTTVNVEAHHDDYSKPLDVRWLCFRHHRELHGQVILEGVG